MTSRVNRNPGPNTKVHGNTIFGGEKIGLLKAIVGGTIGLAVGTMTCQPISGMVGGAFVAQDFGK